MNCYQCNNYFEPKPLKFFCSENCYQNYWKNPFKIEITTICPSCKKEWARLVYVVECFAGQELIQCPNHNEEISLFLTKKYS